MKLFPKKFRSLQGAGLLLFLGLIGSSLPAQTIRNHNSAAPVDFAAGDVELQSRADRVLLTNGVTITQAGLSIKSNRMTVAYSDSRGIDIDRLDATGNVLITKDDLRATSNTAIYDLNSDLVTLIGNVKLTQGGNRLNGGRLVIDLNAGRSNLIGDGTRQQGGRVTGTFTVPKRDK